MSRLTAYLALGLGVAVVVLALYARVKGLQAEAAEVAYERAQAAYEAQCMVREWREHELAVNEQVLAARDAELQQISEQLDAEQLRLREVIRDDPSAQAWADLPVPDSVLQLLRQP